MAREKEPLAREEQLEIWMVEIKTTLGWAPHVQLPRFTVKSDAEWRYKENLKDFPQEEWRIAKYRRVAP